MQPYSFETATGRMTKTTSDFENIGIFEQARRTIRSWLNESPESAVGETDRSRFYPDDTALADRVLKTEVDFTLDTHAADKVVELRRRDVADFGDPKTLTEDTLAELVDRGLAARPIGRAVEQTRRERLARAKQAAWWLIYDNEDQYLQNPFEREPTEQVVIGEGQSKPVNVYNFSAPMRERHITDISATVSLISQLTEGHSRDAVTDIVIHDDFRPKKFARSGVVGTPAGQYWNGQSFIELERSSFEGPRGAAGQSNLQMTVSHEIHHAIDDAVNPGVHDHSIYLDYVDVDGDGHYDRTVPHRHMFSGFEDDALGWSRSHRDYGMTNAGEGFSVDAEEIPFGVSISPVRNAVYYGIVKSFIANRRKRAGSAGGTPYAEPDVINIERRFGSEIELPTIPELETPITVGLQINQAGLFDRLKQALDL